ncbi:MAG: hypothetical protein Q9220_003558 [cf. Caloplaca sp. 1 TL-2023]
MRRTLLLCFIHGFKGGDSTFAAFPEHLRALVSHALPAITVKAITYPQFETRGDLGECVIKFREWLQNVVIDLEVSAGTPSPTVDPSVRTILVGHSMGGIVAAETLLNIVADEPIPSSKPPPNTNPSSAAHTSFAHREDPSQIHNDPTSSPHVFMFPFIQGILAFDTPYLGLSPSLIAHGAESHYRSASSAYTAISELAGAFGYGGAASNTNPKSPSHSQQQQQKALPGPAKDNLLSASMTAASANEPDAAATPTWQRLGKYAMFAGAAGAVAAGGAAAYFNKDTLSSAWNWAGSHLEFVGCLVRGEELKNRLDRIATLERERGIGFADMYTVLGGKGAGAGEEKRTFCNVPKSAGNRKYWFPVVNERSKEETAAHMGMFVPGDNSGYYGMGDRSVGLVVGWVERGGWMGVLGDDGEEGGMEDVDISGDGEKEEEGLGFGSGSGGQREEGVLWGGQDDNPWKMEEGDKGLEGEESVIIERR